MRSAVSNFRPSGRLARTAPHCLRTDPPAESDRHMQSSGTCGRDARSAPEQGAGKSRSPLSDRRVRSLNAPRSQSIPGNAPTPSHENPDTPTPGMTTAICREVFSGGVRNPFREASGKQRKTTDRKSVVLSSPHLRHLGGKKGN